jgi:hypothetical protein
MSTSNDATTYQQIKKRASRFNDRTLALSRAATTIKPSRVMLGDDGKYWVVTPADASRLERMGYEYAN